MKSLLSALASSALILLLAPRARSEPTEADRTIATQLFDDAEKLMAAGSHATACAKYAESQRRDPQLGTLLHLAGCHQKIGKTATAWAEFREASEIAARRNAAGVREPREQIARERTALLEKSVSRVTITVAHAGTRGIEIRQSGEVVQPAVWGSAVPIDPGVYVMSAHAPGKKTWTKVIEVQAERADIQVAVPVLEDEGAPRNGADRTPSTKTAVGGDGGPSSNVAPPSTTQRTIGYVVAGLGTAAIGVGGVFGLMKNAKEAERDDICPTRKDCSPDDGARNAELTNAARTDAQVFNVAVGLGAAALVGGLVLVVTAPTARPPVAGLRIDPWWGPGAGGASVRGFF